MRSENPEGSGHGGVSACSWALVKVAKASGVSVTKACCQRARMGLSVGVFVSGCSKWLPEVEGSFV
jgi:hypothetical protein